MNADLVKLAAACERALVDGARREHGGSRQQLRAAARRFVRRHRRDSPYLGWVLRSVAASSALAVALLGLGAEPASAKIAPLRAYPSFFQSDVGSYAAPALGDLDGDGDLDAVIGIYSSGTFLYYENLGSALFPRTGSLNPFNGLDVGIWSLPSLADLDADGDLDLLSGESSGLLFYFENTGNAKLPAFVARTGAANPMNGVDVGIDSAPAFGDVDADGDLDLFVGAYDGTFRYFENTGNAKLPAFVARTGAANPMNGRDIGAVSTPSLGDLDGDGDLDLVSGEAAFGLFILFENRGNAKAPLFGTVVANADPFAFLEVDSLSTAALGDLDGDGDVDLLAGNRDGVVTTFKSQDGRLASWIDSPHNPMAGFSTISYGAPAFGDLDGDLDLDVISGTGSGQFRYYQNTGSASAPAMVERTGSANPMNGVDIGANSSPELADIDGDADLDLIAGHGFGEFSYFENTGTLNAPAFVSNPGENPLPINVGNGAKLAVVDLDADGDRDFVTANNAGTLRYFENFGGFFVEQTGLQNPLLAAQNGLFTIVAPAFGDVDGDGDLDYVSGEKYGSIVYFENVGTPSDPVFADTTSVMGPGSETSVASGYSSPTIGDLDGDGDLDVVSGAKDGYFSFFESFVPQPRTATELTGAVNPLNGQDVGLLSSPALADLDRDGDHDLLAGEDLGTFRYYENTGDAVGPKFAERTGAANPLNGRDVGDEAKPTFGDLDGDGDFDLLSGRLSQSFSYFQNTGTARTPAFAAPVTNPFGLSLVGLNVAPVLGDLDNDGDLDVAFGGYYYAPRWFENTGTRIAPAFVLRLDEDDPFDDLDPSYYVTPTLGDFDSDGDLDVVHGREHGRLTFIDHFRPIDRLLEDAFFLEVTGAANPLDGIDVGDRSAPAAVDLNADGTPDLVTGSFAGTFAVHYLPEPAQGALLGAGFALLAWLRRRR